MPPASTIGPSKKRAHGADEHEGIEPAGLAAGPAVNSTRPSAPAATARSAWRMLATSAKTSAPASCSGARDRRRRADRGDDDFRLVTEQHGEILLQAAHWSGARSGSGKSVPRACRWRRNGGATGPRCRRANRRAVRGCGSSPSETSRSRRCGRPLPPDRHRRPETSAPRSAAG